MRTPHIVGERRVETGSSYSFSQDESQRFGFGDQLRVLKHQRECLNENCRTLGLVELLVVVPVRHLRPSSESSFSLFFHSS